MTAADSHVPFAETRSIRKLVAVMHMDMVGYSRLIGLDDADTLSRLKALRNALIEPAIDEHGGRIIQTAGDSFLVVFDSIDGAVGCALKVQRLMPAYDGAHPPERQIRFRAGVEIGDVIVDGTDVHGDGVNVAVRLQSMSPPSGVYVSRAVRDHVRAQSGLTFDSVGPLSLKNIARPIEAFSLRLTNAAAAKSPAPSTSRPSLVILPFESLGNDASTDWLASAITDDLTTELSRFSGTSVVARNKGLAIDGKPLDIQQMGREFGVCYALHGSIRGLGQRIWINTQLIDAETGTLIHADRMTCVTANYDEVISRVVRTVKLALISDRRRRIGTRPVTEPGLTDLVILGQASILQPISRENYAKAKELFERALTIDPDLAEAQTHVAAILIGNILDGWSSSPQDDQARAERLLNKAISRDSNHPRAHTAMAMLRRLQNRLEDSQIEWEMAIALDPHNPISFCQLGSTLLSMGRLDAAIANIEKGICVSPEEPSVAVAYSMLGHCRVLQGLTDKAIDLFRKAHARNPGLYYNHLMLAAAFALAGEVDQARTALAEAMKLKPEFDSLQRLTAALPWLTGRRYRELAEPTMLLGLRRAGMAEG